MSTYTIEVVSLAGYVIVVICLLNDHRAQGRTHQLSSCTGRKWYFAKPSNGTEICSRCSLCPAGQEVKIMCSKSKDTVCTPCPNGTFSQKRSKRCHECRKCSNGYYAKRGCTPTHNTVCRRLCKGQSFYSISKKKCLTCKTCPPGTFIAKTCGITEDTVCKTCPPDTFTDDADTHPYCRMCSTCNLFETKIQRCNKTHDTKCGDCLKGYFRMDSSGSCAKCSYCFWNAVNINPVVIDECAKRMNDSDYICMPVNDARIILADIPEKASVRYISYNNHQNVIRQQSAEAENGKTNFQISTTSKIIMAITTVILVAIVVITILFIRIKRKILLRRPMHLMDSNSIGHVLNAGSVSSIPRDQIVLRYKKDYLNTDSYLSEKQKYNSDPSLSRSSDETLINNVKRIHSMSDSTDFKSVFNFFLSFDAYSHFTPDDRKCNIFCISTRNIEKEMNEEKEWSDV